MNTDITDIKVVTDMNKIYTKLITVVLIFAILLQLPCVPLKILGFGHTAKAAPAAVYNDLLEEPVEQDSQTADETILSPSLQALADSLSIVGVYEYVRNRVKSEFYFGPVKGAVKTYETLSGNDYDTAALLVGMLRHKGIPARYRLGNVSLTVPQAQRLTGCATADEAAKALSAGGNPTTVVTSQGRIAAIRIERIWVECYISYGNYRGDGGNTGEKSWIPLDAGFKQLNNSGNIVQESLGLLPPALPYAVVTRMESFSTTEKRANTAAPVIDCDIPFVLTLGETYECSASAKGRSPISRFAVTQNGQPVSLSVFGTFMFEAKAYGAFVFVIEATDTDGNRSRLTHTLMVVEEADMTPPELEVTIDPGDGAQSSPVKVIVDARDDSGVVFVTVTVNDERIDGEDGVYIFVPEESGKYIIDVTATDPSGNRAKKTLTYTLTSTGSGGYTVPQLEVRVDMSQCFEPEDPVYIYVTATDESGDVSVWVKADEQELSMTGGAYVFRPDRYGVFQILVTATNKHGNSTYRKVLVALTEGGGGLDTTPPQLSVTVDTDGGTRVGKPVEIQVTADDDSGEVIVDVKVNDEPLSGFNGAYNFTPDKNGNYHIDVTATDPSGNWSKQEITIPVPTVGGGVSSGYPNLIVYFPDRNIYVGETVRITIDASDESGEVSVEATANGEVLPYNGGIARFAPQEPGGYEIIVTATNPSGNMAYARFVVTAVVNTEKPHLYIVVNGGSDTVKIGDTAIISVGGVGISGNISLTADGVPLTMNPFGEASFTPFRAGLCTFAATADDINGSVLRAEASLRVIDPDNKAVPSALITSPVEGAEITAPTNILGTVSGDGLAYYTLSYAPAGSASFTVIAEGDRAKSNEVLGSFDPTILNNGYYTVRLIAYGSTGYELDEVTLNVQGEMKIGNFSMAFQDMVFPIRNFPLTVSRSYDSRDRQKQGDFGYGWSLALSGATLSVSCTLGDYWAEVVTYRTYLYASLPTYSFAEDKTHEVTVDWGNGRKDTFAMRLSPASQDFVPIRYGVVPSFVPTGNTTSKLEALDAPADLLHKEGRLIDYTNFSSDDLMPTYNPTRFKLTTEDGTVYVISTESGVESITDTLGNKITINRNGVYHSDGKSIAFTRDSRNRITKITGPTGKEAAYRYDESGNLAEVIDITGASTRFAYDRNHFLTDIVDPRGIRAARNEYDDNGRLIAVVDASGKRMEFDNDVEGRRQAVTDRLGHTTLYVYDERGNILSQTDALGHTTTSEYDSNGNLRHETDSLGNVTTFEFTPDGKLLSKTDAVGNKMERAYSGKGQLTTIKNMEEPLLTMSYDNVGNIIETVGAVGEKASFDYDARGLLRSVSDDIGVYMRYTYDGNGNVASMANGSGGVISFDNDAEGNMLSRTITRTGPDGVENYTEHFTYNNAGRLTGMRRRDGTNVNISYNSIGKIESATDVSGNQTTYKYDMFGNLEIITYCDNTTEKFVYDAEGRNTEVTDRLGRTFKLGYDAVGNLTSKEFPNGGVIRYEYDAVGRLVKEIAVNGGNTEYEYDKAGRNTAVVDALGNRIEYRYDSMSRIVSMTDAKNNTYSHEFDGSGNRVKTVMPDGTSISAEYDARGRITCETDQNGCKTKYNYDGADRLILAIDAEGGEWNYSYDEVGNLVSVTDANRNTTSYHYDSYGRAVKTINALGHEALSKYDEKTGSLVESTDFSGKTTKYSYDRFNRMTRRESGSEAAEFAYTVDGKLASVTDSLGVTLFAYDSMDGLKRVSVPGGIVIDYSYDLSGNVTGISAAGHEVTYGFDKLNRLISAEDSNGRTEYSYDANGNVSDMRYPNGWRTTYGYDGQNRLTSETVYDKSGVQAASYRYTLGQAGELLKTEESSRTIVYSYDKLYRLTGETVISSGGTSVVSYGYDAVSNRIRKTAGGTATNYLYNALNQLTEEVGADGVTAFF